MKEDMMTDQKAAMDATDNSSAFYRTFIEHPARADETYWQHAWFATRFACLLFIAGFIAIIHAIVPAWFESTAGRIVAVLHDRVQTRN